ncbi:MAG: hypothetical protein ACJ77S_12700 [Gemmatimonadaceae bacterium]
MLYSPVAATQVRHADQNVFSAIVGEARRFSQRGLGLVGLGSGTVALAATLLGMRSWLLPAAAFALWLFSGCALFFRTKAASRLVSVCAFVLILSGGIVVLAVFVDLYLRALGPAWIL